MPNDRGGKHGPSWKAYETFLKAKEEALRGHIPVLDEVQQKVRFFIEENFDYSDVKITDQTQLVRDIGMDELDMIELAMWAEEEFGYEIDDSELTPDVMKSVADFEKIIKRKMR